MESYEQRERELNKLKDILKGNGAADYIISQDNAGLKLYEEMADKSDPNYALIMCLMNILSIKFRVDIKDKYCYFSNSLYDIEQRLSYDIYKKDLSKEDYTLTDLTKPK
jgi:hypothetical protein